MKFLISVPASLERCQRVRHMVLNALHSFIPATSPPASARLDDDGVVIASDPLNCQLGSGGGTVHLLWRGFDAAEAAEGAVPAMAAVDREERFWSWLASERRVLLHAGGQSRRAPSYAVEGKLLTPLPCFLSPFSRLGDGAERCSRLPNNNTTSLSRAPDDDPSVMLAANTSPHTADVSSCASPLLPFSSPSPRTLTNSPQRLDATLLSHMAYFASRVVRTTPAHLHTLVLCGDVCLTAPLGALPQLRRTGNVPKQGYPSAHHTRTSERIPTAPMTSTHGGGVECTDAREDFGEGEADDELEVDVVCYGLAADTTRLQRHGVFVVDPNQHNTLRCMLQKPSLSTLAKAIQAEAEVPSHTTRYRALLDVGVWLLSDRAVRCLRAECCASGAQNGCDPMQAVQVGSTDATTIRPYDLFSDFGALLGTAPQRQTASMPSFSSLRVRIVDLSTTGTTFHHFGTTHELLESTAALAGCVAPGAGPLFQSLVTTAEPRHPDVVGDYAHATSQQFCSTENEPPQELESVSTLPVLLSCADAGRCVFVQHARVRGSTVGALRQSWSRPGASSYSPSPETEAAHSVWIENADIAEGVALSHHHVLTGFPRDNAWQLRLPAYLCVSVVPLQSSVVRTRRSGGLKRSPPQPDDACPEKEVLWAARVYGFTDSFSGDVYDASTQFCQVALHDWLRVRGLALDDVLPRSGDHTACDIHNACLFPCSNSLETLGRLIQFAAAPPSSEAEALSLLWRSSLRLSAAELVEMADVDALAASRDVFLRESLPRWLHVDSKTGNPWYPCVYERVDLHATARRCAELGVPLPLSALADGVEAAAVPPTLALARACMLCARILQLAPSRCDQAKDDDEEGNRHAEASRAHGTLPSTSATTRSADFWDHHAFACLEACMRVAHGDSAQQRASCLPRLAVQADQVVWARSPARMDLSGGWTDTPPYSLLRGGAVVNVAVEMNGQAPIQTYVRVRDRAEIAIRSVDLGVDHIVRTYDDLRDFARVGSAFSIPKAALALAGFLPDLFPNSAGATTRTRGVPHFDSLEDQLTRSFGGKGMELTVFVAIPAGSGLGTSSIVAGTILTAISEFCGLNWSAEDVCQRVLLLEQLLTTGGGWQDQYGGLFPSVKLVHSLPGLVQQPSVCWLAERVFTAPRFAGCHVLYYTGITRVAKSILSDVVRGVFLNERARVDVLEEMHLHVQNMCRAISYGDMDAFGRLLNEAWASNMRLDSGTCPPAVEAIMHRIRPYARGAKLLGAGGGGFLYILTTSEVAAQKLRDDLNANPPNPRARFVTMRLSTAGIEVGRS